LDLEENDKFVVRICIPISLL